MSAEPMYVVTLAPRLPDGLKLVKEEGPILERVKDRSYISRTISYLLDFADHRFEEWGELLDNDAAEEYLKLSPTPRTDDVTEDVYTAIEISLDDFVESGNPNTLLEKIGEELLYEAVSSLYTVKDERVAWKGDYGWQPLEVNGIPTSVFATGGYSWGDSPTAAFDALTLVKASTIFEEPFTNEEE